MQSRKGNANQLNRSGSNISTSNLGLQSNSIRTVAGPNAIPLSTSYLQTPMSSGYAPPPVPMRRVSPTSYGGRMGMGMGMGSYYSPYSRYPTSMYTPGFGGYRGYGGMGGGESTSSFIQMAEESTRPAFESIESVVEVVSSISMMLESTYHAVHSSYSAILGVVDQFSRLKDHLAQLLSIMALLRGLRWLCLKVLYLLKLRKDNPSDEAAWGAAAEAAASGSLPSLPPLPEKDRGSAWPFLMFVGLVIGAPWLMFKLLSKTVKKNPLDTRVFRDDRGNLLMVITAYEFKASQRDELSFSAGEKIYISPKSINTSNNGWLFACNKKHETGLVPSTYLLKTKSSPQNNQRKPVIQVLGRRVPTPQPENQVPSAVCVDQVSGAQPVNQVPGRQLENQVPNAVSGNQVSGAQPVNQVQILQTDSKVAGSQQPWESYEDLINGTQDFNEVFGQPSNLIDNPNHQPNDSDLPKNTGFQPNNIPSDNPSTSQNDNGNYSESFNKMITDPSTSDNLKNPSEVIKDDETPQEVSNNNTDTS